MAKEAELSAELEMLTTLARSATGGFEGLAQVVGQFAKQNPLKETVIGETEERLKQWTRFFRR